MIIKTDQGWIAYRGGKRLGPPVPTRAEAEALENKTKVVIIEGGTYGGKGE